MGENNSLQIEKAREKLLRLQNKLAEIEKRKNCGVNVFNAVGMQTQEVKHSAFLAWLLSPQNPHGLGSRALEKFLSKLFEHENIESGFQVESNRNILAEQHIFAIQDFSNLLQDNNLTVQTEKVIINPESRIDIFIESQQTKTVILIENKVFTTTHDNQLLRYEEELKERNDWRKVFIYLTPKGDAPSDLWGYHKNWCVFSYRTILALCQELLQELPKTKENRKLRILLEDYIEMVDTNILKGNKELKSLCKQIRREHKEALEILQNYTDNAEDVAKFCKGWLETNFVGYKAFKDGKTSLEFYSVAVEQYFAKHGESLFTEAGRLKFRYSYRSANGPFEIGIVLEKDRDGEWSEAQMKIKQEFLQGKPMGEMFCSRTLEELISEEDREKEFEAVRDSLETQLNLFLGSVKLIEEKLFLL